MAKSFGKYQLHQKIAQGGMAEVFLATKKGDIGGFTRRLAIKRMFSHLVDQEDIINMFIDEARIAARLQHPNIVQIYDLGVVDGTFFIAMEYVEGLDLRRICERGVDQGHFISRPLAVYIATQVAMGLEYAHTQTDEQGRPMNIVHRDVSPQNVLVSVDGAVKVCDFGIAKAENRLTQTQVGEFKGKFSYMSPEQFGHDDLDHRSDIFTLGIVLYETTVGTRLFRADSEYETMQKVTDGDFHPPRRIRPDYPPRLEEIVLKALAIDPDDRYQSAETLQKELEDWLFEQRVRTGPRQLASYLDELHDGLEEKPRRDEELSDKSMLEDSNPGVESVAVDSVGGLPVDEEDDDPTTQMELTPEQMKMLGREDELEQMQQTHPPVAEDDDDDPTVQMAVTPDEIEALRRAVNRDDDGDQTMQDMEPPGAVSKRRESPVDPVEVRRVDDPEGSDGPTGGRDTTQVDEIVDEETTSPIDTPGHLGEDETLSSNSSPEQQDVTGQWESKRRQTPDREQRPEAEVESRRRHPQPTPGNQPAQNPSRQPAPSTPPSPSAQPDVATPSKQPSDSTPSSQHQGPSVDEHRASPTPKPDDNTTTDDDSSPILDEMPDLSPGGRELTGLNVVQRQSENSRQTAPVSTIDDDAPTWFGLNRSLVIMAAAATATLMVGLFVVALVTGGGDEDDDPTDTPKEHEEESTHDVDSAHDFDELDGEQVVLSIDTDPPEASVVVNGALAEETTPTQVSLVDGRDNEIWLFRDRYRPKQLLIPAEGDDIERALELERGATTEEIGVGFFSSPSGAEVYVNGQNLGQTPFRLENMRADFTTHIQLEKDGHRPWAALMDFAGDDKRIDAELQESGTEFVDGEYAFRPEGSSVTHHGQLLGETPFGKRHPRDVWLELEIEADEHQSRHHRLRLDDIGGFELSMELQQEATDTGEVSIDVEPAAAIYVDARALGTAPVEDVELPAGEQTVVLETRGGKRLRVQLDVETDESVDYHIDIDGDDATVERLDP